MNELNEAVRGRYAGIALQMLESQEGSCCASGDCCGGGYDAQELAELGVTAGEVRAEIERRLGTGPARPTG